ncbi:MAG: hypothetical protein AABO58_10940 [Acidobacteriota bacterium]
MRQTRLRLLIGDAISTAGSMREAVEADVSEVRDRTACADEIDRLQSAAHRMLALLEVIEEAASTN